MEPRSMADQDLDLDQCRFVFTKEARRVLGGVSVMWLSRRRRDPNSGFPTPKYFGRKTAWRLKDLLDYCESRPSHPPARRPVTRD
jgi:hypothetical protein